MKPKKRDWRQLQTRYYGTLWNIMEHYGLWKSMEQIVWPVSNISITRFLPGPTLSENCFKDDLHSAKGFFMVHFSLTHEIPLETGHKKLAIDRKISGTHWDDLGWMFED